MKTQQQNSILNNPLRNIGLTHPSSMRIIQERLDELVAYSAIGKYPEYDTDFSFIDGFNRNKNHTNDNLISNKSELLKYSLFWFSNSDDIDKMALDYISKEKFLSAKKLWSSESNYEYIKNLALLLFIESLYISTENKSKLTLLSKSFEQWFKLSLNPNFIKNTKELYNKNQGFYYLISELFLILKPHIKNKTISTRSKFIYFDAIDIFKIIEKFDKNVSQKLKKEFLSTNYNILNSLYDQHTSKEGNTTVKPHLLYLEKIKKHILFIREVNSSNLNECKIICDKFAKQIDQCAISVWNQNVETIKENSKLYKDINILKRFAQKIAIGKTIIKRINNGLETQKKVFKQRKEAEEFEEKTRSLKPFVKVINSIWDNEYIGEARLKELIFKNRDNLINAKSLLYSYDSEVKKAAKNCIINFGKIINGNCVGNVPGDNGNGIEIMDMCRRINTDLNNRIIDHDFEALINRNREIWLSNIVDGDGGWIGGLLGGAIRTVKKNTSCGCGSGKTLTLCCSIGKYR